MRLIAEPNEIADQNEFFIGREKYKEYGLIF
jgi:hypothetical protein